MDWTRIAGSVISLFLGGAFSDSENPNAETPDFQIDPNLYTDPPPVAEEPQPEPAPPPPPQDEGIIGGVAKWAKNLSPEGQKVVAQAMAGGAGGLMKALAAKNAEEDRRDREERAREDKKRRGSIQAFGANAFTPKGIIGPRMG